MSTDLEELLTRAPAAGAGDAAEAEPGLVEAAEAAGLLDVAVAGLDSPLGRLVLAATPAGLARVAYIDGEGVEGGEERVLEELSRRISPRILRAPKRLDPARRQLDEYFAGRRRQFSVALDLSSVGPFGRRVLDAAAALGYGQTATYTEIAARAGSPRGARAAGNALGRNPIPVIVPCHRVLHSTGGLGGYTGGLDRKRTLLALERGETTLWQG